MYWGNQEKTRETFQSGWVRSGDRYTRNVDGTYTYGRRADDMFKVSGIYVSPFEVEATPPCRRLRSSVSRTPMA